MSDFGSIVRATGLPMDIYDNRQNRFDDWMVAHLEKFVQQDLDEYNSRRFPHRSESKAFRTGFDLGDATKVEAVRFEARGTALRLAGDPEVYKANRK